MPYDPNSIANRLTANTAIQAARLENMIEVANQAAKIVFDSGAEEIDVWLKSKSVAEIEADLAAHFAMGAALNAAAEVVENRVTGAKVGRVDITDAITKAAAKGKRIWRDETGYHCEAVPPEISEDS